MKLTVLLNGIDDVPLKDLHEKTPLEVAKTSYLRGDKASELVDADPKKGAEGLLFELLGGKTEGLIPRGPLEAYSLGFRLAENQRAFSARFVSTGEEILVDAADSLLSREEGRVFCSFLNSAISKKGWTFLPFQGPQSVLILQLDQEDDNTFHNNVGENPVDWMGRDWLGVSPVKSEPFLAILKEIKSMLAGHEVNQLREEWEMRPVNGVIMTDGGGAKDLPKPIGNNRVFLYTGTASFIGLAKAAGIGYQQIPLEAKKFASLPGLMDQVMNKAVELGESGEVVWDVPYLWQSTYKGDLLEKIKTIEWLDRNLIEPMSVKAKELGVKMEVGGLARCDIRTGRLTEGSVHRWRF
jgi:2,3-bisphosphoglycerate-independent phosphoglycerate mutase